MADLINLRAERKKRRRAEAEAEAAANRARFGRTGAAKRTEAMVQDAAARRLDGLKLDPKHDRPGDGSGDDLD